MHVPHRRVLPIGRRHFIALWPHPQNVSIETEAHTHTYTSHGHTQHAHAQKHTKAGVRSPPEQKKIHSCDVLSVVHVSRKERSAAERSISRPQPAHILCKAQKRRPLNSLPRCHAGVCVSACAGRHVLNVASHTCCCCCCCCGRLCGLCVRLLWLWLWLHGGHNTRR